MEKFKAVEKAMKTKAYSKEGLNAAARLDPKERAKLEACEFLSSMVEELERQIETMEAESESIQATMKKGKNQSVKVDRLAEIERLTERHKWHQGKLELIKRCLENGGVETDQVTDLEETIRYYVSDGMNEDFMEDDEMYDDLNLDEEEDNYGMNNDNDRASLQDSQSVQEELPEVESRSSSIPGGKSKSSAGPEPPVAAARRPSTQLKSPLPALATLNTPLTSTSNGATNGAMKPAAVPTRPAGETLKYASAAAAAAANVGIAPLPPPPGAAPAPSSSGLPSLPSSSSGKPASTASPSQMHSQPSSAHPTPAQKSSVLASVADSSSSQTKSPALSQSSAVPGTAPTSMPKATTVDKAEGGKSGSSKSNAKAVAAESLKGMLQTHFYIRAPTDSRSYYFKFEWKHQWIQGSDGRSRVNLPSSTWLTRPVGVF
jgi:CCR4-NOT transcription complex subunit 3